MAQNTYWKESSSPILEFKAIGNMPAFGLGVPLPSPSFDASSSEARSVGDGVQVRGSPKPGSSPKFEARAMEGERGSKTRGGRWER